MVLEHSQQLHKEDWKLTIQSKGEGIHVKNLNWNQQKDLPNELGLGGGKVLQAAWVCSKEATHKEELARVRVRPGGYPQGKRKEEKNIGRESVTGAMSLCLALFLYLLLVSLHITTIVMGPGSETIQADYLQIYNLMYPADWCPLPTLPGTTCIVCYLPADCLT